MSQASRLRGAGTAALHWVAAFFIVLLASTAIAQERFSESVQVTLIEVPVTVADRAGNPLRNLTRNDFRLYDEGKRVDIEYFETVDLYSQPSTSSPSDEQPLPASVYRNFVLLFDLANSSPVTIGRARDAARQFVASDASDVDVTAIATYTKGDGVKLITNFTRDRELLRKGIDSIESSAEFRVADPLMLTSIHSPSSMTLSSGSDAGEEKSGGREDGEDMKRDAANRMTEAMDEKQQLDNIHKQLQNLGTLALALDRLSGQKQIILLSEGFAGHLLTGRENLGFKATQKENDAVLSGELWTVDSEKRFGSMSGVDDLNEMAEIFRRADVRLHAIDIRGLRTQSDVNRTTADVAEGVRNTSNESLSLLARPTGGTVFRNSNDLTDDFRRLLRQQEFVYLLGFNSRKVTPGKFHKLRVETTAKGTQIAHRGGYFEESPYANDMERMVGVAELLTKDIEREDIPLTMLASPLGPSRVAVVLEIPGEKLLEKITGTRAAVDLFVYAFDAKREVRDFMQQRIVLDLDKTRETLQRGGIRYAGALELAPGQYSINAVARVGQKVGTSRFTIDVPSFDDAMVLPPLALAERGAGINVVSPARGGALPFLPKAAARVAAGADQPFVVMLHGIPVDDVQITPVVFAADGSSRQANIALVGKMIEPARLLFDFKSAGLAAGDYRLQLTVTPKNGKASIVSMPIAIQ